MNHVTVFCASHVGGRYGNIMKMILPTPQDCIAINIRKINIIKKN